MRRIALATLPIAAFALLVASHFKRKIGEGLMPNLKSAMSWTVGDINANLKTASDWAGVMNADYTRAALMGLGGLSLLCAWLAIIAWSIYRRYRPIQRLPKADGFEVIHSR